MNLRGVTNLEVTLSRMRMVICLQIPEEDEVGGTRGMNGREEERV
jgi:hypothetical protein